MKLRVGIFIDTYFPMIDGVINVVHNYAERLNDGEFEVTVFCPTADKRYRDDFDYRVVRCKSVKIFFLDYTLPLPKLDGQFKRAVKESQLDVVHIHSPFGVGKMGVRYAKKHRIPVLATMHSQFEQDFYRATHSKPVTKLMLNSVMKVFNACDACYAVNGRVAEIFRDYGAKRLPQVLRNGTDYTPTDDEIGAAERVNRELSIAENVPVFLFVGRLTALKNIYFLADALAYLKDVDFKMVFAGDGQDAAELRKRIEANGLCDKVLMIGRVSDRERLKALYSRATLFLFPSMYDASSLVQIEAASQKTPAVFLQGAATSFAVTDGVNGYISAPDPAEYAKKIKGILDDKEGYERVKEGAFRDLYVSWDEATAETKRTYRALVEQKKRENAAK